MYFLIIGSSISVSSKNTIWANEISFCFDLLFLKFREIDLFLYFTKFLWNTGINHSRNFYTVLSLVLDDVPLVLEHKAIFTLYGSDINKFIYPLIALTRYIICLQFFHQLFVYTIFLMKPFFFFLTQTPNKEKY